MQNEGRCCIFCCPFRWAKPIQYLLIVLGCALAIVGGLVYGSLHGKVYSRCSSTLYNNDPAGVVTCRLSCSGDTYLDPGTCWGIETWAMQLAIVMGILQTIAAVVTLLLVNGKDSRTGLLVICIVNSISVILYAVCALVCLILSGQSPAVQTSAAVLGLLFGVTLVILVASAHTTRTTRMTMGQREPLMSEQGAYVPPAGAAGYSQL